MILFISNIVNKYIAKIAATKAHVEKPVACSTVVSASKTVNAVDAANIYTNDMKTINFFHIDEELCFECDVG